MSTDYYVVCDKDKIFWHLGVRFSCGPVFGNGRNDTEGRTLAMDRICDHWHKGLRIVETDSLPNEDSGYEELPLFSDLPQE